MKHLLCAISLLACIGVVLSSSLPGDNVQETIMAMLGNAQANNNKEMDALVLKQEQETARYKAAIDPVAAAKENIATFKSGDDIASSLASMLEIERKHNKDTFKSLFLEQKRHDKINAEVASQRKKVHDRAVFLERLSMCLHSGPTTSKLEDEQHAAEKEKMDYIEKEKQIVEQRKMLEKKEASLLAKEELLSRKDAKLKKSIQDEKQQRSLLETGALKVKSQLTEHQMKENDLAQRAKLLKLKETDIESK